MYISRGRFVCQWPVAFATRTRPKKMHARTAAKVAGRMARRRHLSAEEGAFRGTKENCKASCAGHAATHAMQAVHSTDRIRTNWSTGRCDGQTLEHFPQSMQASVSRRIFAGLNSEDIPNSAPYGQRYRHQKFWTSMDSRTNSAMTITAVCPMSDRKSTRLNSS